MEGDPLFEPGRGLEYLFGCWMPDDEPQFRAFWGTTRDDEKRAFEAFVDFIVERRRQYPAHARLPLRELREVGAAPARAGALHARGRDRRPAARRGARRSLRGRAPGARDLRGRLRPQETGALLRSRARDRGQEGRRVDRDVRALDDRSAISASSTTSRRTTATTAARRICCATGCSTAATEAIGEVRRRAAAARTEAPDEPCHAEFEPSVQGVREAPRRGARGGAAQRRRARAARARAAAANRGRVPPDARRTGASAISSRI